VTFTFQLQKSYRHRKVPENFINVRPKFALPPPSIMGAQRGHTRLENRHGENNTISKKTMHCWLGDRAVASLEEAEGHQHLAGEHGAGCEQMYSLFIYLSRQHRNVYYLYVVSNNLHFFGSWRSVAFFFLQTYDTFDTLNYYISYNTTTCLQWLTFCWRNISNNCLW